MADILTQLHACGYPTPRVLYAGQLRDGEGVYVQEWLPGQMLRTPGVWTELNADELQLLLANAGARKQDLQAACNGNTERLVFRRIPARYIVIS